jgi:sugar lactone lactonase YvrE
MIVRLPASTPRAPAGRAPAGRTRAGRALLLGLLALACTGGDGSSDTAAAGEGSAAGDTTAAAPAPRRAFARRATVEGFRVPESALHDAELDVWFVSNIDGDATGKDGNGFIARVTADGDVDSLRVVAGGRGGATLHAPKGLALQGDTLWVADIDAVRGFQRRTGAPVASISLAGMGAVFLNDIARGPDGALYVTDTGIRFTASGVEHPGPDRIFRIEGRRATVALRSDSLAGPNGIAWDSANARFLIASYLGDGVFAWKPGDAAPARVATGVGQFDGIAVLRDGRVLVTSWADSALWVLDGDSLARAMPDLPSPADLGTDASRSMIAVPLFTSGRVTAIDVPGK